MSEIGARPRTLSPYSPSLPRSRSFPTRTQSPCPRIKSPLPNNKSNSPRSLSPSKQNKLPSPRAVSPSHSALSQDHRTKSPRSESQLVKTAVDRKVCSPYLFS